MESKHSYAETEAIIRVTSYHRRDKDEKVISFRPLEQDRIRACISTAPPTTSLSSGLGCLGVLPAELLLKVCLKLDIGSLFRLRQVNIRSRQFVTGIFEYRAVATHATAVLLALFRTNMAKHITLLKLYQPLTEKWCVTCGEFGGFLFIPTAMRCCLDCIYDRSQFPVMTLNSIFKRTKIPIRKLQSLMPVLKTVPGWYGRYEHSRQQRHHYVAFHHALEALENLKGIEAPEVLKLINLMLESTSPPEVMPSREKCESSSSIPTFDSTTSTAYWSLSCKGCATEISRLGRVYPTSASVPENIDKVYSKEGFLAHFQVCKKAKSLWTASEGGTKDVSHLESRFSINGGFDPARLVPERAWPY